MRRHFPPSALTPNAGERRPTAVRDGGASRVSRMGILLVAVALVAAGCAKPTPEGQSNICTVFDQFPDWYDHALDSKNAWGTPIHIQMAFVRHESSFRSHAKPPMEWFWFIPLGRPSSAKGYAQAQDPAWGDYRTERGYLFKSRSDMEDALDFIGWYNHKTWRELKISREDAYNLYLAYHEGRGGYRSGTWKNKPKVQQAAKRVADSAAQYRKQLAGCEANFHCDAWYQIWPFCS